MKDAILVRIKESKGLADKFEAEARFRAAHFQAMGYLERITIIVYGDTLNNAVDCLYKNFSKLVVDITR